jgi:hypothetical protein
MIFACTQLVLGYDALVCCKCSAGASATGQSCLFGASGGVRLPDLFRVRQIDQGGLQMHGVRFLMRLCACCVMFHDVLRAAASACLTCSV